MYGMLGMFRDTLGGKIALSFSSELELSVNFPFPPLLKCDFPDFPEGRNRVWNLWTTWDFEDRLALAQQTLRPSWSFSKQVVVNYLLDSMGS